MIWPALLLIGIEKVKIVPGITPVTPLDFVYFPFTHSLVAEIIWAALLSGGYWLWRRDNRGPAWIGGLVLSHWLLDALSHRPDVPTWPGGPVVGAGLWYSLPLALIAEFALLAAGVWIYVTATRPRDRLGSVLLWAFVATLIILYLGAVFGPPALAASATAMIAPLHQLDFVIVFIALLPCTVGTTGIESVPGSQSSRGPGASLPVSERRREWFAMIWLLCGMNPGQARRFVRRALSIPRCDRACRATSRPLRRIPTKPS